MIKKAINRLLKRRHFWRHAEFDELSEIYVAMMLRSLALGMVGIFIPVYLLTTGHGFKGVATFFASFFFARVFADILAGYAVARFGPKHTMLVSYILQIVAAGFFLTIENTAWPLALPAILWGASNSLFFVAFHVDFSKIKHSTNGGKELGFVNIAEKLGHAIGPAVGGVLATVFNPQYIFLVAILLLMSGLIPLFKTAEPVKTRQHLDFKGFSKKSVSRDYISYAFFVMEHNAVLVLWPVFLTLVVFTDKIYATIGALTSIGVFVAMTTAYLVGKLVDSKKGGQLLRVSTITNAVVHLFRPFVSGIYGVLFVNISSEALSVGSRIPYTKGWYDASDSHPGHRIVYLCSMESFGSFTKFIFWLVMFMWIGVVDTRYLITAGFVVTALASLLINVQKFKALE